MTITLYPSNGMLNVIQTTTTNHLNIGTADELQRESSCLLDTQKVESTPMESMEHNCRCFKLATTMVKYHRYISYQP